MTKWTLVTWFRLARNDVWGYHDDMDLTQNSFGEIDAKTRPWN